MVVVVGCMVQDDFFEQEYCDRCHGDLSVRTTSWFNRETICANCSRWEDAIISACAECRAALEGIGGVPEGEVDFDVDWGEEPPEELFDT